jgi:hypothetical protein
LAGDSHIAPANWQTVAYQLFTSSSWNSATEVNSPVSGTDYILTTKNACPFEDEL